MMRGGGVAIFLVRWCSMVSVERYFTSAVLLFVLAFVWLPSSKAVNNFYYIFLALPALWVFMRGRREVVRSTPLLWLWVAFLLWALIATVQVQTLQYLKHWIYVVVFCALMLFLVDYRSFRRRCVLLGVFYLLLAYVLMSTLYLWFSGSYQPGMRVGDMPMRLSGPTYGSIVLVAFFALAVTELVLRGQWLTLGVSTALVVFVTGYLLQSRAGVLGAFLLIGLIFMCCLWCGERWWQRLLLVLCALVMVVGLWWLFNTVPTFQLLIQRADSGRFELWDAHYQAFLECRIWLGCAPTHFADISIFDGNTLILHPHNILFSVLLHHGWVGALTFLATLVLTFRAAWQQRNPWGLFLLASLLMLMFEGSGLINQPNELWLLIFLPCMLILAEQVRSPKPV